MFNKIAEAVEPFALTLVVIAGASLAGWVEFSNKKFVGILVVLAGMVLIIAHVARKLSNKKSK